MLWSILLIILGFVALFALFVSFSPIKFLCKARYKDDFVLSSLHFSFVHPWIFDCVFDPVADATSIILLHRFTVFSFENNPQKASADSRPPEPEVPLQGQTREQTPASEPFVTEKASVPPVDVRQSRHDAKPDNRKTTKPKPDKKEKPPKQTEKKESDQTPKKGLFGFFKTPLFKRIYVFLGNELWRKKILSWMLRSALRFFKIVSFTKFKAFATFGLDDPAKTGKAFGYFLAFKNVLVDTPQNRFDVDCEPDFNREIFEAQGEIEITTSLARLFAPVVLAVLTFPYIHTLVLFLRMRKIKMDAQQ